MAAGELPLRAPALAHAGRLVQGERRHRLAQDLEGLARRLDKFNNIIKKFSEESQFIIITHINSKF